MSAERLAQEHHAETHPMNPLTFSQAERATLSVIDTLLADNEKLWEVNVSLRSDVTRLQRVVSRLDKARHPE